jgi:hypothetical protein
MSLLCNELMLGNWVKHNPDEYSYRNSYSNKSDFKEYFQWEDSDWYALLECTLFMTAIEPIQLTEEILLKSGFVKLKPQWSLSVGGESLIYYLHEKSGFIIWYHGRLGYSLQQVIRNTINPECTCFDKVHELQNIFYWNKKKQHLQINL